MLSEKRKRYYSLNDTQLLKTCYNVSDVVECLSSIESIPSKRCSIFLDILLTPEFNG